MTLWEARGKGQEHVPISLLHKKFKPIGACSGYRIVSLCLPGHLIPATLFNGFRSLPATYFLECFEFLVRVRLLHELGDADRRLTGQDRLFGLRSGRAEGGPAPHVKPTIMAMTAPQIRPHTPYLIWLH